MTTNMSLMRAAAGTCLAGLLWAAEPATTTSAADWPCWRGADGSGASPLQGIAKDWSHGLKKVWERSDLCGASEDDATWSAPAISRGLLVLPGRTGSDDLVWCVDAGTGTTIWKKSYSAPGKVSYGAGSRATPWIEGDRVYTFGCLGHLACWNLKNGQQLWLRNVTNDGGAVIMWGLSSSPLIDGTKLIVQAGGTAGTVAYDKNTGAVLWQSKTGPAGYAAPVPATLAGRRQLLVTDESRVLGLDPESGTTLWSLVRKTNHGMNCATPIVLGNKVLLASNIGTQLIAVNTNGVTSLWNIETPERGRGPCHADPVVVGDTIYEFTGFPMEDKLLRCLSLADGKELWTAELGAGWLMPIDGHLLCLSNRGKLVLIKPNPAKFEQVTECAGITGKPVWTAPIVAGTRLYLRCKATVVCYQL